MNARRRQSPTDDLAVCPFTVIIDSREQAPFAFRGIRADAAQRSAPLVVPTKVVGLATGDYSIDGWANLVAVERKSLDDLYGTLGRGRERFERELVRLDAMVFAAVVIEAGWGRIVGTPPPNSRLTPKSVFRSILAYMQRFRGVHWITAPDRRFAEIATFRVLERFWKDNNQKPATARAAGSAAVAAPAIGGAA